MARSVGIDRAQVVAVAAQLADANGLEQLTLAQVAAQLGVRLPSLYNHVDGLAGLHYELALYGLRELLEQIRQAAIGKSGEEAVIALAQAYRAFVLAHPGVYPTTIRASNDEQIARLGDAIIQVIIAVLAPFELGQEDMIHAIRGLRSIVHGFATLELAGGFGIPLDRDESFVRLLKAYIQGLARQQ
jgi:AcrR family transcriptional regulator